MTKHLYTPTRPAFEKAIIVGVITPGRSVAEVTDSLDELALLADTAGACVIDRITQTLPRLNPATYIGTGKVQSVASVVASLKADLVIFDDDLSPVQIRNLEKSFGCKLLDRSGIILDIFARRAKTAVAKTQVELAQLEYLRTRLTRHWTHLSRQQGGIGTRGPGETQIETDRRLIGRRMVTLRQRLAKIDRQRTTQRYGRRHHIQVSLVGYTNAGKSTLMNALAGSAVLVEDRLFATLDATTRLAVVGTSRRVLLSDTVGFIRKLPHNLIESFKSTLDEVRQSDVLLHVINAVHPRFADHIGVVNETLGAIGAMETPILMVFNKIDKLESGALRALRSEHADAAFVSALRNIGLEDLGRRLQVVIESDYVDQVAYVPVTEGKTLALIRRLADVESEEILDADSAKARPAMARLRYRIARGHARELVSLLAPYADLTPES